MTENTTSERREFPDCGCSSVLYEGCRALTAEEKIGDCRAHVRAVSEFCDPWKYTTTALRNEDRSLADIPPTTEEEERRGGRQHSHPIPRDPGGCVDETIDRIFRGNLTAFARLLDADKELVRVEPDEFAQQRRAGIPRPARFKIICGLETESGDPPWVRDWIPTADGSLKLMAPGPGGFPSSPKGVLAPKPPRNAGTSIKAPHQIPHLGPDEVKPRPSPPQSARTDAYNEACGPVWHSGSTWRRLKSGLGKCKDGRVDRIRDAFGLAYQVIRSAELEMAIFADLEEDDRRYFWDSYKQRDLAAPGYWFGQSDSPRFEERFWTIFGKMQAWSMAFRHGFWDLETGVLISCRADKGGTTIARHFYLNIIELYERWFQFPERDAATALVMLHEMGHKSDWNINFWGWFINSWGGAYALTDSLPLGDIGDQESGSNCKQGTNNKCYLNQQRTGVVLLENIPQPFNGRSPLRPATEDWRWIDPLGVTTPMGIEPRALAVAYDGTGLGYSTLVFNLDNYVSWMWNRWLDHGYGTLAPPGTTPDTC